MYTISIGDIQKNISLLTKLTEAFTIVDKRKNQNVAIVYPIKKYSIIETLAGKYRNRVERVDDLEMAKEEAMRQMMSEKYGLSY
ncbi:MAG TPA: hypothetical protein EYG73_08840 [Arcobacter sp.]|nr:hypothetical protein [Arcobacter sp.]